MVVPYILCEEIIDHMCNATHNYCLLCPKIIKLRNYDILKAIRLIDICNILLKNCNAKERLHMLTVAWNINNFTCIVCAKYHE